MLTDDHPGPRVVICDRCSWWAPADGLADAARLLVEHGEAGCGVDRCYICHQRGGFHFTVPHANRRPPVSIPGVDDPAADAALTSRAQPDRHARGD